MRGSLSDDDPGEKKKEAPPRVRRSRVRRIARYSMLGVTLGIAGVVGLAAALEIGFLRPRLIAWASATVEARTGIALSIGRVDGGLLRPLVFADVRVGPMERPLLTARRMEIRIRPLSSLRAWSPVIARIEVSGWTADFERLANGTIRGLPDFQETEDEPADPKRAPGDSPVLSIDAFELGPGTLTYRWNGVESLESGMLEGTLTARGRVAGLRWTPGRGAEIDGANLDLAGKPGIDGLPEDRIALERLALGLELDAQDALVARLEADVSSGRLEATVESRASALIEAPERAPIAFHAVLDGVRPEVWKRAGKGRLGALDAVLDGRIEDGRLTVSAGQVEAPGLALRFEGAGTRSEIEALDVTVDAADLSAVGALLATERPIAGAVSGSFRITGPRGALRARGKLEARGLESGVASATGLSLDFEGDPQTWLDDPAKGEGKVELAAQGLRVSGRLPMPVDVALSGDFDRGRISLPRVRVEGRGLRVGGSGQGTRERVDRAEIVAEIAAIESWIALYGSSLPDSLAPLAALSGSFSGQGRVSGPIDRLAGDITLTGQGLRIGDRTLGALSLAASRQETTDRAAPAKVHFTLDAPDDRRLVGDLVWRASSFELDADGYVQPWLGAFRPTLPIDGDGRLTLVLRPREPWPTGRVSLSTRSLTIADTRIDSLELAARSEAPGRFSIDRLEVGAPQGRIATRPVVEATLEADGRWSVEPLVFLVTPTAPEARGGETAAVETYEIAAEAAGRAGRISLLEVSGSDFDLAELRRFVPELPPLLGHADAQLAWRRTVDGRPRLEGEISLRDAGLAAARVDEVALSLTTQEPVGSGPSRLLASLTARTGGADVVTARSSWPMPASDAPVSAWRSPAGLEAELRLLAFDVAALEPFTPRQVRSIAGVVRGTLRVEHDGERAHVHGQAELRDGAVDVPVLRRRFAPIEGEFSLEDEVWKIGRLRIGKEGASADLRASWASGKADFPGLDGLVRLDHFPVSRSPAGRIDVSGSAVLGGDMLRPRLEGEFELVDAQFQVAKLSDPVMREIRFAAASGPGELRERVEGGPGIFDRSELDFKLSVPSSTRIRGEGANLWIEGDLAMVKRSLEAARYKGEARVVNGAYTFQGRKFRVRRGVVSFPGTDDLDPLLDLEGELRVADINALLIVTGRLSSPDLRLRSEPPLPQQDILSYVLFGRPASQVGASQSAGISGAAARLAAGVAESELRELLGDKFFIDTIEIGADEEGNTSEIGVGKFVSRDLFISYKRVLGDEPSDEIGVEYRFSPSLSVGSTVTTTGDAGVDLIWRRDF